METYNCGQNLWNNAKKSSKTEQDKKTLISIFTSFLAASPKVLLLERRLGTRLCLHPFFRFFQYFTISFDPKF